MKKICLSCNKEFTGRGVKYCCRKCSTAANILTPPLREEFEELIVNHSNGELAIYYSVSEWTITKWRAYYGLEHQDAFLAINQEEFKKYFLNHSILEIKNYYGVSQLTILRWARLLDLPRKCTMWKDCPDIKLSNRQMEIVVGSMLGDGHLTAVNHPKSNSQFTEYHAEKQKGWVEWKYNNLQPLSRNLKPRTLKGRQKFEGKVINDPSKNYKQWGFQTIKHPILTKLELEWYKRDENRNYIYKVVGEKKHRLKIVPSDFCLTPLILAVWFIDDGCNPRCGKNRECHLYTNSFDKIDVLLLIEEIKKLGIYDCHICVNNKQWAIRIGHWSYLDFINLIKEQLTDLPYDVSYKLDTSNYKYIRSQSTSIPYFRFCSPSSKHQYYCTIRVNNNLIYLGEYDDEQTAINISNDIMELKKQHCIDVEKYKDIKKKYQKL